MLAVVERMNERHAANGEPKWVDPRQQKETDPPEHKEIVPHGFRSTFRDWAAERTNFPNEMVEMALAHAIDGCISNFIGGLRSNHSPEVVQVIIDVVIRAYSKDKDSARCIRLIIDGSGTFRLDPPKWRIPHQFNRFSGCGIIL
jgi:hypothetical protein